MDAIPGLTIDQKLKAIEIAERSVHQPYLDRSRTTSGDCYEDKDIREILRRADRFMAHVLVTEDATQKNLIERLRDALCKEDK